MVCRRHDHDYSNQNEDEESRWLMPHPLAYLYRVSLDVDFLKITMKEYCTKIYLVRKEHKLTSARIFSSASTKQAKELFDRLERLDDEEKELRAGFELARCLWQLEHTMVKTNLALTKWRRSKNQLEELLDGVDECGCCACCGYQYGDFVTDSLSFEELQKQLEREEEHCSNMYEKCGDDQAKISKEIATHLGILTPPSGKSTTTLPQTKCDDFMIEYVLKNYCKCSGCIFFYNKKDLGIFGQIHTTTTTRDSSGRCSSFCSCCNSNGDGEYHGVDPFLLAETIAESGRSCTDEEGNIRFRSFYCLECYEIMQEEKERREAAANARRERAAKTISSGTNGEINRNTEKLGLETDSTAKIDTSGDSSTKTNNKGKDVVKDNKDNNDRESDGMIEKEPKSNNKKKRRRKKKKKKATQAPPSSSSTTETDWNKVYFSTEIPDCTPLEEEEKRDEPIDENVSGHEQRSISVREGCPDGTTTITTTISSTSTSQLLDNVTDAIKTVTIDSMEDNRNDIWVDYLWKTGSMIALDRYMDEMEGVLGN